MKRKILSLVLGGMIFLGAAIGSRAELPGQTKELDQFFKAKALVFAGDWSGVRSGMESYLKAYPSGKMEDEALFWLAQSLDRLAREAKDVLTAVELKRQAFASLDRLVKEHPDSLWRDDGRELQVTLAGSLAVLGATDQVKFLEEAVGAGGKNRNQIKAAALRSILSLDSKTALSVLANFLKTESDPDLRTQAVTLLGQKYSREVVSLLEETEKSDPDADVRKEAGLWREKIRIRLIPVQVSYYCFETEVTDLTQYAKVPEGQIARFEVPHGRTGGEARAKREIERVFKGGLKIAGSQATMMSSILEPMSSVSHLIGGFRIELKADSLVKTEREISGRIRFGDAEVPFKVDATNDLILAARKGSRQAVMFLEMSPAEIEDRAEEKDNSTFRTKAPKPGQEPFYSSSFNIKGAVISSTRNSTDFEAFRANVFDYGLAKAEISGRNGTWTLIGEILQQKKENLLIGRMAKLIRPDGTTAAEGAEIRVPIADPEKFSLGKEPEAKKEFEYPLANGGSIRSPRPASAVGDSAGGLLDFGLAKASLSGPGGKWTLTGRLTLLVPNGQIMAYQAVLTNPQGKTAAEGALLFVPVKEPDQYKISMERIL